MNYYERHLGDYAKATAHLSMLEHGAYGLLLDRYYGTEQGIPHDQVNRIARARTASEKAALASVLAEFFVLADGRWTHGRCDAEIEKTQKRIEAARANGKAGGRPKSQQNQQLHEPGGLSMGSENATQVKALHTPDSIHHTKSKTNTARKRAAPASVCVSVLLASGFDATTAAEFIAHKDRLKAPLTELAWLDHLAESRKAGWTPQAAAEKVMAKTWKGFEAKYVASEARPGADGETARERHTRERVRQMTGGILGNKPAPMPAWIDAEIIERIA